jgi:hypothetical protein
MTEKKLTTLDLQTVSAEALPSSLGWLSDAPLYIDSDQIERFYDAVVRPQVEHGDVKLTVNQEQVREIAAKLGIEGGVEFGGLLGGLAALIAKPSVKVSGEGDVSQETKEGKSTEFTVKEIRTPQRQLEQLVVHYLLNQPERIFLPSKPAEATWRDPSAISRVPRGLAFLDLPGLSDAAAQNVPETKLIPMAAEFENGVIDPLFVRIEAKNGERSPAYPEAVNAKPVPMAEYQEYWKWFDRHFSAKRAMEIVEKSASQNGRIRWIDYRVPITNEGHTLHLHVAPGGKFDTGVFAYNLIKRGLSHGVRLIGTLKSGPDMNVLAIYDK